MATTPQPPQHAPDHPAPPPKPEDAAEREKERAAEAKKVFDAYEKDDEDLPLTTQTDQLRRSMDMEKVGVANWMAEQENRIRSRQGDPPIEPRQVHGVAPAQKPR